LTAESDWTGSPPASWRLTRRRMAHAIAASVTSSTFSQ
jgi:hypothetical protein